MISIDDILSLNENSTLAIVLANHQWNWVYASLFFLFLFYNFLLEKRLMTYLKIFFGKQLLSPLLQKRSANIKVEVRKAVNFSEVGVPQSDCASEREERQLSEYGVQCSFAFQQSNLTTKLQRIKLRNCISIGWDRTASWIGERISTASLLHNNVVHSILWMDDPQKPLVRPVR